MKIFAQGRGKRVSRGRGEETSVKRYSIDPLRRMQISVTVRAANLSKASTSAEAANEKTHREIYIYMYIDVDLQETMR